MFSDVLFSTEGQLGVMILNRPHALNALTLQMILGMQEQLLQWQADSAIKAVVIRAAEGAAFCAGGDVRWLYHAGKSGNQESLSFFWHEYRLNYFIHHFSKPYIALLDGITMGGGVGVSLHGSHPVVSERFVFAMPETSIGFFPDIGVSYLLNQCPGSLGVYLGLTGDRLGSDEACQAGIVKHQVPSARFSELYHALVAADLSGDADSTVENCLSQFAIKAAPHANDVYHVIEACFSKPTVESILAALMDRGDEWSLKTLARLNQKCPLSLKVTLAQLRQSKGLSLADCLKMDYVLVQHLMKHPDFYEGVRALLIDKDKTPHWQPPHIDLVTEERVASCFDQTADVLMFN